MTAETCPHIEDIPLLALGVLDDDEAASLRAHADGCTECSRALSEHHAVVGQLDAAFVPEPAPAFESLVLPKPEVIRSPRPTRRRRFAWAGAGAALTAAAVVALALALDGSPGPAAVAAVHSELAGARTSGQARLFHPDRPDGRLELQLSNVPPPPAGTYYAVWVLPRGQASMEAIGSFVPRGRSVDLTLSLPGSGDYGAVDISIQRSGGPSAHSKRSLAGGAFHTA